MSNEPMLECWSANRRGQREGGAETLLSLNRSAGQGRWFVHVHVLMEATARMMTKIATPSRTSSQMIDNAPTPMSSSCSGSRSDSSSPSTNPSRFASDDASVMCRVSTGTSFHSGNDSGGSVKLIDAVGERSIVPLSHPRSGMSAVRVIGFWCGCSA